MSNKRIRELCEGCTGIKTEAITEAFSEIIPEDNFVYAKSKAELTLPTVIAVPAKSVVFGASQAARTLNVSGTAVLTFGNNDWVAESGLAALDVGVYELTIGTDITKIKTKLEVIA